MTRNVWTSAIGASAIAVLVSGAGAATFTWQGDVDSSWAEGGNWDQGTVPGVNDDVILPSSGVTHEPTYDETTKTTVRSLEVNSGRTLHFDDNKTLTVTDLVNVKAGGTIDIDGDSAIFIVSGVDKLDIDPASGIGSQAGRVRINEAGAVLRLSGQSTTGNHVIDGDVLLMNATGKLDITNNVKVGGNGKIQGSNAAAQIAIASGSTFTSTMASASGGIRGFMQIVGPGSFASNGLVDADGGMLELAATLGGVSGSGDWEAASSSTLKFSEPAPSLTGDFTNSGLFHFAQSVATTGLWTFNCAAQVTVATDKTFEYGSYSGTCDDPGTDGELGAGNYTCTCNP